MIEDILALVYEANNSNLDRVLRKMRPLVMQLARNGTEEEKSALMKAFWACWESWTSPKKESPQLEAQAFYPVLQAFLPYLNNAEARIMLLESVFLLGGAAIYFEEIMAEHLGPDLQASNVENTENYMRSIIGFLPAMTDDDLRLVATQHLNTLNEVALHLVADLTLHTLDNLSLILPHLNEQTKREVVSRLKRKFIASDSTTKTSVGEVLAKFLVSNLDYFNEEAIQKLHDWAMRLIGGTEQVDRALGRLLIDGLLHRLDKQEQQKAQFMLRLFT